MQKDTKKTLTSEVSRADFVVLAVYILGGDTKGIDTEDIAVKCNELAPGVFVWKKYKEQINLKLIEAFLYDAKKPKYGELLSGTSRKGWRLTNNGMEWVLSEGNKILEGHSLQLSKNYNSAGSIDSVRKDREKRRLISSNAWQNWSNGESISLKQAQDVFRINEYISDQMLDNKIVRIRSLFQDDKEINIFLEKISCLLLNKEK